MAGSSGDLGQGQADAEFLMALFAPDRVFELAYLHGQWRAFYRAHRHNDYPERPNCNYRSAAGSTVSEALLLALAGLARERLK